ncbi:MAG TPA: hypothetical protein DCE41_20365 [Cytophagales bacterium]|nr:hypothetical protein [Cytophagales bacterium]
MALQTIKVILASSRELAQDVAHLEKMMMRTNGARLQKGLYIKSEVWEEGADPSVLTQADLVVMAAWSHVGPLTLSDFDQTLQQITTEGNPPVLAFLCQDPFPQSPYLEEDLKILDGFKNRLKELNLSPIEYTSKEVFWELLSPELDRLVDGATKNDNPEPEKTEEKTSEEPDTPDAEVLAPVEPTPVAKTATPQTKAVADGSVDAKRKGYEYYPCEELPPVTMLGQARISSTTFKSFYHKREHDTKMREHYDAHPSSPMLVTGNAQSGKSRAAYQLMNGEGNVVLCVPNMDELDKPLLPQVERYEIPVIYLDDLELYLHPTPERLAALLKLWDEKGIKVIATVQKGEKIEQVRKALPAELWQPFGLKENQFEIPQMRWGEAMKVKSNFKKGETPYTQQEDFDGNIGSIFINLNGMRQQYLNLEAEEEMSEAILYAIKVHYYLDNYEAGNPGRYSVKKIQEFVRRDWEMDSVEEGEWKDAIRELSADDKGLNFVSMSDGSLYVEESFLEAKKKVIAPESTKEGASEVVFQDLYPEKEDQEVWGWLSASR